MNDIEWNK